MRKRVIYGYRMENGVVAVNVSESETIRRIFDDYIFGCSIRQVMQALNADGVPSPNGTAWTHRAVGNLLGERRYLGDMVYPAIISEEIFAQVQAKRQEINEALGRAAKTERGKPVYNGMIFCGHCGRRLYWIHYRGKDYWECGLHYQGKRARGGACGNARQLTDMEIEKAFVLLQNRIFDGSLIIRQSQKRSTKRLEMLKAKYKEMLENVGSYEEKSLADVIFWIAEEEYAQSKGAEDKIIMQTVQETGRTAEFREDVFMKIVRKIIVTETEIRFELINGQQIQSV